MTVTREQAIGALLTVLNAAADFKTIGRRNRAPESFTPAETPALMLLDHSEVYTRPSRNLPPIRVIEMRAVVYSDVGDDETAIPASIVNTILDRIDALMAPDDAMTGAFRIGGLVHSAMIDGDVVKAPGDITGKSLAVVPIKITLP